MAPKGNISGLRRAAWSYGRELRDQLLFRYSHEYGIEIPPPPALIVEELLTDFMNAKLRFDPLGPDVFAQTDWIDEAPVVTVNSLTAKIQGVKYDEGIQKVAMFHEAVHVDRDLEVIMPRALTTLPGFETPSRIACYWKPRHNHYDNEQARREFWAEEAGRAAAVSYAALGRSEAFREFSSLTRLGTIENNGLAWSLIYKAAADIGVNPSALVKQLELEGLVSVERVQGRSLIYVQRSMLDWAGT